MKTNPILEEALELIETLSWDEIQEQLSYTQVKTMTAKIRELEKVNSELLKIHDLSPTVAKFTKVSIEDANDKAKYWQQECLELQRELNDLKKLNNKLLGKVSEQVEQIKKLTELI